MRTTVRRDRRELLDEAEQERIPARLEQIASAILGALAACYLLVYVGLAVARMTYPFELEFLEGTSVTLVGRILAGENFYARPSVDFVSLNYTPLYYYLSAALALFTGVGFFPLRLVSFLSSLACIGLIFQTVRKETGSSLSGLLGAGLFAASYGVVGAWFDLGRIDSLFLALFLGGAYIVRFHTHPLWTIGAATLIAMSFFTKQTAALIAPALLFYSLVTDRRQFAVLTGALVLVTGGGLILLGRIHGEWFSYYVFDIARLHQFSIEGFHRFWRHELLPFFFISIAVALYLFRLDYVERRRQRLFFYLPLTVAAIGASWMIRSHQGAYLNVLIPACAALAMTLGVAFGELARDLPGARRRSVSSMAWLYALTAVQFLLLYYNPLKLVPSTEDRRAGESLVRQLKEIPGEIWLPQHGYLAALAGKSTYANAIAIADVVADPQQGGPGGLQEQILNALGGARFSAILFGVDPAGLPVSKPGFIDRFYRMDRRLHISGDPQALRAITGLKSRPELLYVPR